MEEQKRADGTAKHQPGTRRVIFVVEDEEGLSHLLQKNLRREGYHTEGASSGEAALAFVAANRNALMLLDYSLPDMSGRRVVEILTERQLSIPFIIMTGHADVKVAVEMMKLGARDFVVKDAEFLSVLPAVVKRVVEQLEVAERLAEVESKLLKSEERYHDLIEFANAGIIVAEGDVITDINKRAEELYGYEKDELIGQSPRLLTPEQYWAKHYEVLEEVAKYGRSKTSMFEEEGIRKDGTFFPLEISFSLTGKKNKTVIGVIRDLTERKKRENEIREAKEFLENLFQTSTDAIMVTDAGGYITMVNGAMEGMVGYGREELLGMHTGRFTPRDEGVKSQALKIMERLFNQGKVYGQESLWLKKDGQQIFVEFNLSLLKDKDGTIVGGVNFIRDVTEKKKMEQQLLQSEKLKSLGELAGGVAHDFNNILAAILGRVQLLRKQLAPPLGKTEKRGSAIDLEKGLEIIERASLDGAETVRRIQEFCRRRGDQKDFVQVDLNELIENALEFTKVKWADEVQSRGIKIEISKALSSLPPIMGSASELREVFTNLINNAVDALPRGGEIRVQSCMNTEWAVITIEDTGGGIPLSIKDRIFDPFFTTKGPQSTGLGLSVSYGIINRHHGTITAESMEGKGTAFTIKLPLTGKADTKEDHREKVIPMQGKHKKARILVIDDEADVRELLRDILSDAGHDVEMAHNGCVGIEMFEKQPYDLVLTDLGMPVMSGWEVAGKIRQMNKCVPIALVTGWNVVLDDAALHSSGVNLVVHKPFQVDQVLNLVKEGV
ncbi:MAG: putative Histidine kinase, partial [Deltaproteobacteria bacterium]|nr:putative Histidine kinase [Deltaproteobacteria bacterium]